MFELLKMRLRQGTPTSPFPSGEPSFPERFRGLPVVDPAPGAAPFDVGACLFSPEEAGAQPAGTVRFTGEYRMASRSREGLVSPTA